MGGLATGPPNPPTLAGHASKRMDREWILLNPGPANTTASVKQALVMPDLCHREPECFEMLRRCRAGLVRLAEGGPEFAAVLFTGSGTAAVEAVICSAVP